MHDTSPSSGRRLRVGSLFSGYGGLHLAVKHTLEAETSGSPRSTNPSPASSPHTPKLGDITTDWNTVPPVDMLSGGFPCLNVSTLWASRLASPPALAPASGRAWPPASMRCNPGT